MVSETDEAAGLSPGNEENEADRCFSPEKPRLPLSIEGIAARWIFRRGRFRRLRRRGIRIGGGIGRRVRVRLGVRRGVRIRCGIGILRFRRLCRLRRLYRLRRLGRLSALYVILCASLPFL